MSLPLRAYGFLLLLTVVFGCRKPPVHYLRPIANNTRDSREVFGCRINGIPFIPLATDSASMGTCTYRKTYNDGEGFVFRINGDRHESACEFSSITIVLDSIQLAEGMMYPLGSPGNRKNYAIYFIVKECADTGEEIFTTDDLFGYLRVDRINIEKQIVTGTFDFKVRDKNGNLYRMSDGVFDRHYTN